MRHVLALVLACIVGLLAASPASAAAEAPIRDPEFTLRADGFLVTLRGEAESARVMLTFYRHGQMSYYETAAQITEDSVKARFGRFGELDYTFTPRADKRPKCKGADGRIEGTFRGTFDFTGEDHYVSIDADHAHGSFELFPAAGCKGPPAARVTEDFAGAARAGKGGVTLTAAAGGRGRGTYLLAFTLPTKKGPRVFIKGFRAERLEGMVIERGVEVVARPGALDWDRAAGIARLTPPAPFRGNAELRRRPHSRSIWRGSLRIPVLGGQPIGLTGGRFRASIGSGSITE